MYLSENNHHLKEKRLEECVQLESILHKYAYMDPSIHDCRLLTSRLDAIHKRQQQRKGSRPKTLYPSTPYRLDDAKDDDDDDVEDVEDDDVEDDDDVEAKRSMSAKAIRIIDHSLHLLDQIEVSRVEHRVNAKQLLYSMTSQRKALGRTRSFIYDTRAFSSIPFYAISPSCFNYQDIESDCHLMRDLNVSSSSSSYPPPQPSSSSSSSSQWIIYKDPLCRANNNQPPPRRYYINSLTGELQEGEPFDTFIKRSRQGGLRVENW